MDECLTSSLDGSLATNGVAMMGLIGFYNTYICGIESRAILPYC